MTLTESHAIAEVLGGFVAAEGTFTSSRVASPRGRERSSFTFAVTLGGRDRDMAELLHRFLGVGRVRTYRRRKAHFDDETVFAVRAFGDLVDVVIPFMDEHLPSSHKRQQYLAWRAELLAYDRVRRGRR